MSANGAPSDWDQLETLFEAALALPPGERSAFLDRECPDPALRAELESLLARAPAAERLFDGLGACLETLPARLAPTEPRGSGASTADPLLGRSVGHYRIEGRLGSGGMGVVYRARDTRLEREVALKFLPPHLGLDPGAKDRFLAEARAAAALEHPAICTVHEIEESEDGRLFIAMACYEGETLEQRIARGPLPMADAVAIATRIASGLAAAHARGVVHRDVKPGNVMLTADGGVKLLDFGLAKVADVTLTRPGTTPGTVAYMSPEQVRGEPVDARTDLWSLGVVLYEMLTGVRPFRGESDRVLLGRIPHEEPEPLCDLRPEAPGPLARIVERLLRKYPDARHRDVEELLADLEQVRSGARPPRLSAVWRRSPRRLAGAVAALLLGLLAMTIALRTGWPGPRIPQGSIAVLPFVSVSPEDDREFFSAGVTEEIITHLSAVPDLKVISRTSAMRYKGSDRSLREIADELGVAHILEGSVRQADDGVRISVQLIDPESEYQLWSSSYDGELADIFGLQERIAQEVVRALETKLGARGDVSPARRGTRDPEALELFLRARHLWTARTREGHDRAQAFFEAAIERDSAYADAYAGLAFTHLTRHQLDFSGAPEDEAYSRIKWAAERALALDESSADAHAALAVTHWWQRNWPGAERELLRALELNPGHAAARTWYALLLQGWGRPEEAMREIRRAHDVDPFAPVTSVTYASFLCNAGRYDRAIEQWQEALDLGVSWWMGRSGIAMCYVQAGRSGQAIRVMREVVEEQPRTSGLLADLAYVLAAAGDREEAVAILSRARQDGSAPFNIARAYVALNQPDSAFAWLRRSPWQWPHRANRFDPALDPLRADPRFEELSARVERDLGIR